MVGSGVRVRPRLLLALALMATCTGAGVVIASAGGITLEAQAGDPGPRPNVIVVMTDDQEARSMWAMPKVRRLVGRHGASFRRFYTTYPLCCPSRATLLTGQYAHNHGVLSNEPERGGGIEAFDDSETVAAALRRDGYRTAYLGKYLNGYAAIGRADPAFKPPGWSRWFVPTVAGDLYDWVLNENGTLVDHHGARGYQTDVLARKGARFIRTSTARPFFMVLSTVAPHVEVRRPKSPNPRPARRHRGLMDRARFNRPQSFNEQDVSDKPSTKQLDPIDAAGRESIVNRYRARLGSLLAVDELVERLFDALRERSQIANTYVIFTSDNGFLLGQHRIVGKAHLYEESVRVPMLIRGPAIPQGVVRRQLTGNIDITPTILAATGATTTLSTDGISLLPLAADAALERDRSLLFEVFQRPPEVERAVRTPGYMYAEYELDPALPGPEETELYDIAADPFQLESLHQASPENLAKVPQSVRDALIARLAELRDCAGVTCQVSMP